jgi:hypothetical protein
VIGGTFTNGLLLLRKTTVPPNGAGLARVTVPMDALLLAAAACSAGRLALCVALVAVWLVPTTSPKCRRRQRHRWDLR